MRARLVAEHPGMHVDRQLVPSGFGIVPRYRLVDGAVVRLDAALRARSARPSGFARGTRLLAASPDLSTVVGAGDGELTVVTGDDAVHRLPFIRADSAVLVTPTRLLVTGPLDGSHRIALVDVGTGAVVDEVVVDVCEAGMMGATPHPTDGSVVLDAGEGQDGSHVFVVRIDGEADDRLVVDKRAENVVVAGFDSTGERLLITPHPSFEARVVVLGWPDLDVVAAATGGDLGHEIDFYGCFLDDERVLLRTYADELIVCDDRLTAATRITFDQPDRFAGSEVASVMATGPGSFAVGLWRGHELPATVWSLDP